MGYINRKGTMVRNGFTGFRARRAAALAAILIAIGPPPAGSASPAARKLSAGLYPSFYLFGGDYFGIGRGAGADLVLRCEIGSFFYLENRLGGYAASQDGISVRGLNGQLGVITFLPYLIPYRPSLRAGVALMTCDPVVSKPVETFRPSQTVLYLVAGSGVAWSVRSRLQLEFGADVLITPYRYRVYNFYRQYVDVSEERFIHAAFTLGASYTF